MSEKVGGIEFDVKVDAQGAIDTGKRLVATNKDIENSFTQLDQESKKFEMSMRGLSSRYSKSSSDLKDFISEQILAGRTIDENGNVITAYGVKAKNLSDTLAKLTSDFKSNESRVKAVDSAYSGLTKEAKILDVAIAEVNEEIKETATLQSTAIDNTEVMSKTTNKASKAFSGFSRNIGMGGVQIGQFAGQIQGGQSALLAFSQQGADIGMLFGPAGMIAGGILAVGAALAGSLIPSLFEGSETAKKLADELRELAKTSELTANMQAYLSDVEKQESKERKERIKELQEEIDKNEKLQAARAAKAGNRVRGGGTQGDRDAKAVEETNAAIRQQRAELDQLRVKEGDVTLGILESERQKREAFEKTHKDRIDSLTLALGNESALLSMQAKNRLAIQNGLMTELQAKEVEADSANIARINQSFETLKTRLEAERMAILHNVDLTEQEKAAKQAEYDALMLEAERLKDEKLLAQDQAFSDARVRIKEQEEAAKRQAVAGAFNNMAQLMNTESRKLFEIGKAAAIAGAVVTGYDAAVTNYKKGSDIGGPPVGAAFAAASLAATFAQIKSIKSTQFGAGGAGQSIQGGQVANTQGGQVAPQNQNISVSGIGPDDFVRSGSLIDQINSALGDGYTINFAGG